MLDWLRKRRAQARAEAAATVLAEETRALEQQARALCRQRRVVEATELLRSSGNPRSEAILVDLLGEYGYFDRAIGILRSSTEPYAQRKRNEIFEQWGTMLARTSMIAAGWRAEVTADVNHLFQAGQIEDALDALKASDLPADRARLEFVLGQLDRGDELEAVKNHSERLKKLRAEGRLDELRSHAEAGDDEARKLLVDALAERGDTEQLKSFAAGDEHATLLLLRLLAKQEKMEELRAFMIAGDTRARDLLVPLLGSLGRFDDLRNLNDRYADAQLIDRLLGQGLADEAATALRERPNAAPTTVDPWYRLADLYAEQGRVDEAITVLREKRIDVGLLSELLAGTGQVTEAIAALDASKRRDAPRQAARMRAEHGRLDELRARADAGDRLSAEALADALATAALAADAQPADAPGKDAQSADGQAAGSVGDELGELRARAAAGEWAFQNRLIRTLGRLGRLDDLEALAADLPAARPMWWATELATAGPTDDDVLRTLDAHGPQRIWIMEEPALAEVIDLLVEKHRIDVAIAFAKIKYSVGVVAAKKWIPDFASTTPAGAEAPDQLLLTNDAVAAIQELLPTCAVGEERSTTLRIADVDYALYGDLRVARSRPDRADISLACWYVNMDTARYFGDHPPDDAESKLAPEGTAVPDLAQTIGFIEALAARLKVRHIPQPSGDHLTIPVSLPLAT